MKLRNMLLLTLPIVLMISSGAMAQQKQMNRQQMQEMLQDSTMRTMMMQHMAQNPQMRREMMRHMTQSVPTDSSTMMGHMRQLENMPMMKDRMQNHMQMMKMMMDGGMKGMGDMMGRSGMRQIMPMHVLCLEMMQQHAMPAQKNN